MLKIYFSGDPGAVVMGSPILERSLGIEYRKVLKARAESKSGLFCPFCHERGLARRLFWSDGATGFMHESSGSPEPSCPNFKQGSEHHKFAKMAIGHKFGHLGAVRVEPTRSVPKGGDRVADVSIAMIGRMTAIEVQLSAIPVEALERRRATLAKTYGKILFFVGDWAGAEVKAWANANGVKLYSIGFTADGIPYWSQIRDEETRPVAFELKGRLRAGEIAPGDRVTHHRKEGWEGEVFEVWPSGLVGVNWITAPRRIDPRRASDRYSHYDLTVISRRSPVA